ncbi:DivIVA domain-containing protein [Nocardioides gilvus]|uniref:DivIVA domain-containing protein n=1 Tax=Nocardioides gilvus TaxID=1735589 RepID=UPI001EF6297F|nr:DivIVA domain-containing protein [Nocardioides gilvus]
MMWLAVILGVLVLGVVAAVAAGRFGHLPDAETRLGRTESGGGPVRAQDLRTVRFGLAFRGYRMDEVDALLDRVAEQLEQADEVQGQPSAD